MFKKIYYPSRAKELVLTTDFTKEDIEYNRGVEIRFDITDLDDSSRWTDIFVSPDFSVIYDETNNNHYYLNFSHIYLEFHQELNDFLKFIDLPKYNTFKRIQEKRFYYFSGWHNRTPEYILAFYAEDPTSSDVSAFCSRTPIGCNYEQYKNAYCFTETELLWHIKDFFKPSKYPPETRQLSENSYILLNIYDSPRENEIIFHDLLTEAGNILRKDSIIITENLLYSTESLEDRNITEAGKLFIHKFISENLL